MLQKPDEYSVSVTQDSSIQEEYQNADIFKHTEADFEENEDFLFDNFYNHDDLDRSNLNSEE